MTGDERGGGGESNGGEEAGRDRRDGRASQFGAADREAMQGFVDRHGFLSWLDIAVVAIERGRVVFEMPYDEKLLNPAPGSEGSIHGGVAATLVDTASGFALRTTFDDSASARLTTTDLDVKYLRPARDDLVVEADVVRAGGSMGVTDVTVESTGPDGQRTTVAVGSTSYRLFREDGP